MSVFWLLLEDTFLYSQEDVEVGISPEKVLQISELVRLIEADTIEDYEKVAMSSGTEWDKYLISTTPEMPTALSDFYTVKVLNRCNFKKFWSRIILLLDVKEKDCLITYLSEKYEDLTENRCVLPSWL